MKSLVSIAILAASVPSLLPSGGLTTVAAEDMSPVVVLFGKVTEGMDVADEITAVETRSSDVPIVPALIESAKRE